MEPSAERDQGRILVVDDAPSVVEVIEAILGEAGYDVTSAGGGFEAMSRVAADPPDLVLLDVVMPDLDGYEVCRRLKSQPAAAFLPVVMVTGLTDLEDRVKGIEAGADDFLTKPVSWPELLARVRSLLRIKRLQDQVRASHDLLERQVAERTADLQRALHELHELNRSKAEFLANISHELRTPLTPIKGYLQTLLAGTFGPVTPEQREGLGVMQESIARLHRLIEDLIAFARIERGSLEVNLEPVDLAPVLGPCLSAAARLARGKRQTFQVDLPPGLPAVLADPRELPRAVGHLLENATKFTPAGGSIRLSARSLPGDRSVEVEVADTGIGISPHQRDRIFEPFHQVDGSLTRRHGGAGLGLAIVRQLLTAHGARIDVECRPGAGATFRFRLAAPPAQPGGDGGDVHGG